MIYEKEYINYLIENKNEIDSFLLEDYFLNKIDFEDLIKVIDEYSDIILTYYEFIKKAKISDILNNDISNIKNNIITIKRRGKDLFVLPIQINKLDKSKCSNKFISNNFPEDMIVYVKCLENGKFDLRGKREEYRIIPNNEL